MVKIITIDGPAGVGKSTIAKKLSKYLDAPLLVSGKLYRAVACEAVIQKKLSSDITAIKDIAQNINVNNYNDAQLYNNQIDQFSSKISSKKSIRQVLVNLQRNFPKNFKKSKKFCIIEGRDIGTIIFPKADIKIFMWASSEVRASRRLEQVKKVNKKAKLSYIRKSIMDRDFRDMSRKIAPLMPAADSYLCDNSNYSIEQSFKTILRIIKQKNINNL